MFLGCSQAKVVHTGVADRAGWLPMVRTRPCDWLSTTLLPSQISLPFDFQLLLNNSIQHQWDLTENFSVTAMKIICPSAIDILVTGIYNAATFSGRLGLVFNFYWMIWWQHYRSSWTALREAAFRKGVVSLYGHCPNSFRPPPPAVKRSLFFHLVFDIAKMC